MPDYSQSTNTASQGHPPLTLLQPIYSHCLTGSFSSCAIVSYLQSLIQWVIFLSPYFGLFYKHCLIGSFSSFPIIAYLQTLPHWVILLSSYCSLSTVTDSLVIILSPYYGLFYKGCLTWSSSSYPIIACLQKLPHWVILFRPYFGLF